MRRTKHASHAVDWPKRALGAAVALAGLVMLSEAAFGQALSLGPGMASMEWVVQQDALELIALLLGVRVAATLATVYGGGVGGLFIPLCTMGVIAGQFVGIGLNNDVTGLYPILGLAAFLGAGYRTPIAAVMFVAESTRGGGAFVVPALIAAAVSQVVWRVVVGERIPAGQAARPSREPLRAAYQLHRHHRRLHGAPGRHRVGVRLRSCAGDGASGCVPVVSGITYLGMARLDALSSVDREDWETTSVESLTATDLPVALPSWTLRDAVLAMDVADIDILAVTDNSGNFIGIVTEDDVVRLGEILDETEGTDG